MIDSNGGNSRNADMERPAPIAERSIIEVTPKNRLNVKYWQDRLYRDEASRDPVQQFLNILNSYLSPNAEVIDFGAGAGRNAYDIKGRVNRIIGVDLSPRVLENPLLDQGVICDVSNLPFPDASFDLGFSIYVLEHIRQPEQFTREVARVLKPGGYFLAMTPNRYHYVTLASSLTSTRFHKRLNALRGRDENDTFPTQYLMNTRRTLSAHFERAGFSVERMSTIEVQPNYLTFSTPTFLFGAAWERLVNATELLAALRVNIICVMRKCESPKLKSAVNQPIERTE